MVVALTDLVGHYCRYACAGKDVRDVLTTACDGAAGAGPRQTWPVSHHFAFVGASQQEFDAVKLGTELVQLKFYYPSVS